MASVLEDTEPLDTPSANSRNRRERAIASRQKNSKRYKVDPTTCDREYSPEELEFGREAAALQKGRGSHLTDEEVVELAFSLGYRKGVACVSSSPTPGDKEEFVCALASYRKGAGRLFPTWSEKLEVLRNLGYHKLRVEGGEA